MVAARFLALFRPVLVGASLLAGSVAAWAQAPQCDAWRAELARLNAGAGGGNARAAAEANRVGAELGQAAARYRALQCDAAWVFSAPPPECRVLAGELGRLRSQHQSLIAQAGGGDNRRRALQAAINDNCRPGVYQTPQPVAVPQPQQPRSLFEAIFGVPDRPSPPRGMPELDGEPLIDPDAQQTPGFGSGRPVCVRLCDGFFFPLSTSPGGRAGQQDMCSALCPATETRVFYMGGNGDISSAFDAGGRPYTALPNANRFTTQFDPACSCRQKGQSWAQALAEAEEMLERRRGDVIVSERQAEEMSRPRVGQPQPNLTPAQRRQQERQRAIEQANQQQAQDQAALDATGRAAPTAGNESAGIGAQGTSARRVTADQGERREVVTAEGERRTVRVIAPEIAPARN